MVGVAVAGCGKLMASWAAHMANSGTVPGPGTHLPVSHQSDTGTASLNGHMNVLCHAIIVHTYCA